jgi:hypothetical protein
MAPRELVAGRREQSDVDSGARDDRGPPQHGFESKAGLGTCPASRGVVRGSDDFDPDNRGCGKEVGERAGEHERETVAVSATRRVREDREEPEVRRVRVLVCDDGFDDGELAVVARGVDRAAGVEELVPLEGASGVAWWLREERGRGGDAASDVARQKVLEKIARERFEGKKRANGVRHMIEGIRGRGEAYRARASEGKCDIFRV